MKVLIVGGGGREHAMAWKVAQSEQVEQVFVAPGNAGTALEPDIQNVDIDAVDIDSLLEFAQNQTFDRAGIPRKFYFDFLGLKIHRFFAKKVTKISKDAT